MSTSTVTWNLDPSHSSAEFKVKHMMISNVKGSFTGLTGTLTEDISDPMKSRVSATIDIGTINTGDAQRDTHLKSADFSATSSIRKWLSNPLKWIGRVRVSTP